MSIEQTKSLGESRTRRYVDLPDSDVSCDSCRYNLRGQPLDGRCPECGISVAESAARVADRLRVAVELVGGGDERRMSDLRWGPWLVLAGGVVVMTLSLLPSNSFWGTVRMAAYLAAGILAVVGVVVSTRLPRDVRPAMWAVALSVAVRALAWVFVLAMVGCFLPFGQIVGADLFARDIVVWASVIGTTFYFLYTTRVAWSASERGAAVSSMAVVALSLLAVSATTWGFGVGEFRFRPTALMSSRSSSTPILGLGLVIAAPLSSWFVRTAAHPFLMELFSKAILLLPWAAMLALVQLGLMSGRRPGEGSDENTASSSRP
jgi:hypothetical protein